MRASAAQVRGCFQKGSGGGGAWVESFSEPTGAGQKLSWRVKGVKGSYGGKGSWPEVELEGQRSMGWPEVKLLGDSRCGDVGVGTRFSHGKPKGEP